MTPQELKNSILQLAIQGKLVEQRPEEGTAQELYEQIQAEKQRLIKEGKIKKEKPLPEITEEEKPFEIPEGWMWVRLGSVLYKLTDGTHSTPKYTTDGVPFLSVKDISSGKLDFSNCKYISEQEHQELYSRCNPEYGDLLLTKVGTTGIPVIVDTNIQFSLFVSVALLKFDRDLLYNKFLKNLINSPLVQIQAAENTRGVGNKNWVMRDIANTLIVLPPLAEQKRIVAKIEELLPLVDRYEQAWTKLEDFNRRFPEDMKKSILQQAIQGKLVEQRPEEGTAQELYEQIQIEKQRLIKEGKLKKEKPLPEITEEEKPFEIPEGWMWVRIGDVVSKITDGTHHSPPNSEDGEYKYITAKNIKDSGIDLKNITYVSKAIHDEIYSRCNPDKGDVLLIKDGATTGVVTVNNIEEPFSMLSSVALLKLTHGIFAWYLVYVLRSNLFYKNIRSQMKGTGITRITLKQIVPLAIPLPPFDEQKRIVERLEELLAVCERLKQK